MDTVMDLTIAQIQEAIKTPNFSTKNAIYSVNKNTVFVRLINYSTGEQVTPTFDDIPKGELVAMGGCGEKYPVMSPVVWGGFWGQIASNDLDHYANPVYSKAPEL